MKKGISHKLYWTILKVSRKGGFWRGLVDICAYGFYKIFRANKTFTFQNRTYKYFYHLYNRTVASERIIEIPIARELLNRYKKKKILEVGNVLSHYFPIKHDVLDKYENAPRMINEDVVSFKPDRNKKYDLIISISTMEHVGYSYGEKKDSTKFLKGVKNLKKYLAKGGKLIATFPVFYNPYIDKLIKTKKMPFDEKYYMKRSSFWNEWKETNYCEAIKGSSYDNFFANANVLYVGIYNKK